FTVWARKAADPARTWGTPATRAASIGGSGSANVDPVANASGAAPTSRPPPPVAEPPAFADTTAPAAAPAPKNAEGIPLMAALGYSTNDLELGLGVRGGKTFASHIYVGGA